LFKEEECFTCQMQGALFKQSSAGKRRCFSEFSTGGGYEDCQPNVKSGRQQTTPTEDAPHSLEKILSRKNLYADFRLGLEPGFWPETGLFRTSGIPVWLRSISGFGSHFAGRPEPE
jgi:hypothetical protein